MTPVQLWIYGLASFQREAGYNHLQKVMKTWPYLVLTMMVLFYHMSVMGRRAVMFQLKFPKFYALWMMQPSTN